MIGSDELEVAGVERGGARVPVVAVAAGSSAESRRRGSSLVSGMAEWTERRADAARGAAPGASHLPRAGSPRCSRRARTTARHVGCGAAAAAAGGAIDDPSLASLEGVVKRWGAARDLEIDYDAGPADEQYERIKRDALGGEGAYDVYLLDDSGCPSWRPPARCARPA